jgi:hypothetical protein
VPDGTACGDTNTCNGDETCQAGVCTTSTSSNCNDGDPCTVDSCDATNGCRHLPVADGGSCTDGNVCNGNEVCQGGGCTTGTPLNCTDVLPCTTDSCDQTAGRCEHVAMADGLSCSDNDVCNGVESCRGGICLGTPALSCSDGNPCTLDLCSPTGGCSNPLAPNGSSCSDGNACNGSESCQSGVCTAGTPLPNGSTCNDGNFCNGVEVCQGQICSPGTPPVCSDNDGCTADLCDPVIGCHFTPLSCDDQDPDTVDTCSPTTSCQHASLVPGTKLLVRGDATRPTTMKLKVSTNDSIATSDPPLDNTPSDPVQNGGSIRILAGPIDRTYLLPAHNWEYAGERGDNRGYKYTDMLGIDGPINKITLRDVRAALVRGRGQGLNLNFTGDPRPVRVVLSLGATRYCMSFGGFMTFSSRTMLFTARDAPAPGACPP